MPPYSTPKRKKRKKTQDPLSSGKEPAEQQQQQQWSKVTLKVRKPNAAVDPVLVSFPGGVPSSEKPPPEFEWLKLQKQHGKSKTATGEEGRMVQGKDKDGTCLYRATSQGNEDDNRRTKFCIGIYDKQKGVVTVHQVASSGTVFALEQHLQNYQEKIVDEVATNSMELFADFGSAKKRKVLKSQQSNRVNVDTVVGSGKAMIDSMMMMNNDNDGDNKNNDKKTAGMSESNRKAIEQARRKAKEKGGADNNKTSGSLTAAMSAVEAAHEKARRDFLPPYNAKAESICNVYDFRGILGESGWGKICRMIDAYLHQSEGDGGGFVEAITLGKPNKDGNIPSPKERHWSPSVLDCLRLVQSKGVVEVALQETKQEGQMRSSAKHQLRCVLMLHFLIRFYKRFGGGGQRGWIVRGLEADQPRWFGIPREAALTLLSSFATQHHQDARHSIIPDEKAKNNKRYKNHEPNPDLPRYVMPPANKDRCLVHILLVYLLARGGPKSMMVDDMTLILEDLDIDAKHAGNLLRMAGCTVATSAQIKRTKAFLTVPLTFPQPRRRGKKGGK